MLITPWSSLSMKSTSTTSSGCSNCNHCLSLLAAQDVFLPLPHHSQLLSTSSFPLQKHGDPHSPASSDFSRSSGNKKWHPHEDVVCPSSRPRRSPASFCFTVPIKRRQHCPETTPPTQDEQHPRPCFTFPCDPCTSFSRSTHHGPQDREESEHERLLKGAMASSDIDPLLQNRTPTKRPVKLKNRHQTASKLPKLWSSGLKRKHSKWSV
jgi:hypothetical protein